MRNDNENSAGSSERDAGAHLRPEPRASHQEGGWLQFCGHRAWQRACTSAHFYGVRLQTERSGRSRGSFWEAPEVLQSLVGQGGQRSQGLRRLLLFLPSSQVKRAAAGPWTKGRQAGGRAGVSRRARGERRVLSAKTQPRGQGHNAGDSFGRNKHAFLSTNCC